MYIYFFVLPVHPSLGTGLGRLVNANDDDDNKVASLNLTLCAACNGGKILRRVADACEQRINEVLSSSNGFIRGA